MYLDGEGRDAHDARYSVVLFSAVHWADLVAAAAAEADVQRRHRSVTERNYCVGRIHIYYHSSSSQQPLNLFTASSHYYKSSTCLPLVTVSNIAINVSSWLTADGSGRRACEGPCITVSVPHFFWLWQKWVYQSVQRHTGLAHPF